MFVHISFYPLYTFTFKSVYYEPISFLQSEKLNIVFILKKYYPQNLLLENNFYSGAHVQSSSTCKYVIAIIRDIHIIL